MSDFEGRQGWPEGRRQEWILDNQTAVSPRVAVGCPDWGVPGSVKLVRQVRI